MNISPEKIAPPVAFVIIGFFMLVLGAIGVIPFGNPQPVIGFVMKHIFIVLGVCMIFLGPIFVWKEKANARQVSIQLPLNNIQELAVEVVKQIRMEQLDQVEPLPHAQSLFEERKSHFKEEKKHLADHFITPLMRRCRFFAESGKQVHLLIDSGTTLYPFFEKLGNATVRASSNGEEWIKKFSIETNSIPGILMLMQTGRADSNNRYSRLAVNCDLLPGIPLPVYSALTGPKTETALQKLREEAGNDAVFIALTTGNWIRLRRSKPECPLPLARGKGHLDFKQALIDYSDEIYVVTPLGKVFVGVPPEQVNTALGFDEKQQVLDKEHFSDRQPYHEIKINDEKAEHIKMVSTSRGRGYVLSEHSVKVRAVLNVDGLDQNNIIKNFHKTPIVELPHLIFPFDKLSDDWYLQIETEFPHPHTRNEAFMGEFFSVPLRNRTGT